jgi:hypothetical protein
MVPYISSNTFSAMLSIARRIDSSLRATPDRGTSRRWLPSCSYTSSAMQTWVAIWAMTTARPAILDTSQGISYAGAQLTEETSQRLKLSTIPSKLKSLPIVARWKQDGMETRTDKDRGRQPSRHLPLQDHSYDTQPSSPRAPHQLDQGEGKGRHQHPRQSRFSR